MPREGHLIVPPKQVIALTPFHKVTEVRVMLDEGDAHWLSGYGDTKTVMLAKSQIEELGAATEISIVNSHSVPVEDYVQGRENVIRWQATATINGPGGDRSVTATYELDMRIDYVDGVDGSYIQLARNRKRESEKKAKDNPKYNHYKSMPAIDAPQEEWDTWVEENAVRDWTMTNRHRLARAETGAALRAMRSMLKVKSSYNATELQYPFIVIKSEIDWERAIQYGGEVGKLAMATLGGAFSRQLGMTEDFTTRLLGSVSEATKEEAGPSDLFPADESDIENLVEEMVAAGFPNRAACDARSLEIFEIPVSQLTRRHVQLMHEYVALSGLAKSNLDDDGFDGYREIIADVMRVAYAKGTTIEDEIELSLWDRIHDQEVVDAEEPAEVQDV